MFLVRLSQIQAKNFFNKNIIEASFNPSIERIKGILKNMSQEWKEIFADKIRGANQTEQLDSLVDLRNSFSHGNEITVSIADVINYYNSGKWILERLFESINYI